MNLSGPRDLRPSADTRELAQECWAQGPRGAKIDVLAYLENQRIRRGLNFFEGFDGKFQKYLWVWLHRQELCFLTASGPLS